MNDAELHTALREVVAIGRRGGYDNDEIAEKLAGVVHDYAADELRAVAAEVRYNHGTASLSAKRIDTRVGEL